MVYLVLLAVFSLSYTGFIHEILRAQRRDDKEIVEQNRRDKIEKDEDTN
jgi:hypothetical protein